MFKTRYPDVTPTQPNIVLFLTDDHGAWANRCYGNAEIRTPHLDALASRGVLFDHAFTPTPVCSPARACLLTGRTASQVGIHDWLQEANPNIGQRDWLASETGFTLPELLHGAGYHTGLSGKWHVGQSYDTPRGFDWCFGMPGAQGVHDGPYTYHLNGTPVTLTGNKTALITDHAIEFLHAAPSDKPFFLNVGYIATHSPYEDTAHDPAVVETYRDATFTDVPAYTPHPRAKDEGVDPGKPTTPAERLSRLRGYYAGVTEIDHAVGRIVASLRESNQLDNTIILYTSDHGCALGHHGFWGKGNSTRPLNMYETSLRVPLIWSGPGVAPGVEVNQCVDHYDTFQSVLGLTGIDTPTNRDYPGTSYAAALRGQPLVDWSDTRFGEYGDLRMVRTPRHKLVWRYPNGPHDLFELETDPGETRNLSTDPGQARLIDALKHQIDTFYARHEVAERSGLNVKNLPRHNEASEAWRDGLRERAQNETRPK